MDLDTSHGPQLKEPRPQRPLRPGVEYETPRHRRSYAWVWLLCLLLVGAGAYFAWRHFAAQVDATKGRPDANRTIPVVTATARKADMNLYLNGLGTVAALNTVTVRARVDGQLMNVAFTEGQTVKENDLLFEIDPRPFQVQLEQAEGQMAKDQAQLKNARADLQKYLNAQEAVSQQQIDTARANVAQFEGAIKMDQAQIDSARLQITYCRITSPINGRIGLRMVDKGNMVHASDANGLAVITQLQPIAVLFPLPQDEIPQVIRKMSAGETLVVEGFDRELKNRLATGSLLAVDSQIDPTTGTVRFKAIFPNQDNALFPNQFVNARLLIETLHDAVIVPAAAVQRSPESTFVYIVKEDNTVDMRNVVVGPTEADQTAIESGLAPGEIVVTEGVDKLQQGSKVSAGGGGGAGGAKPGSTRPTTNRNGAGGVGPGGRPAGGNRPRSGQQQ
jgi:multidrug efflux system membrane fusion protein